VVISNPSHSTPKERDPFTHWIGGWVGHRASLDVVIRRKIDYEVIGNITTRNSGQKMQIHGIMVYDVR
jgi:hypothetical protein